MTKGESEITDEGNKPEGNTDQNGAQLDIQIDVIDIEWTKIKTYFFIVQGLGVAHAAVTEHWP